MKKVILIFAVSFLLGGLLGYLLKKKNTIMVSKDQKIDFVYKGNVREKLHFKIYEDTLYQSDKTVYAYHDGAISTPKCAAEVASALLEEIYGHDVMKNEYPLNVTKDVKCWEIYGTCPLDFGMCGMASISLYRPTGMIVYYGHY